MGSGRVPFVDAAASRVDSRRIDSGFLHRRVDFFFGTRRFAGSRVADVVQQRGGVRQLAPGVAGEWPGDQITSIIDGRCCGSAGRAVASDTRDSQFVSQYRQNLNVPIVHLIRRSQKWRKRDRFEQKKSKFEEVYLFRQTSLELVKVESTSREVQRRKVILLENPNTHCHIRPNLFNLSKAIFLIPHACSGCCQDHSKPYFKFGTFLVRTFLMATSQSFESLPIMLS